LNDAFIDAGYGLGNTFNGNLPPVRIDFILYSAAFESYDFNVHGVELSDHYPISTFLSNTSGK
jgi:endonuclease/exonuclease/phosphatase family metal-dependent hydrolase